MNNTLYVIGNGFDLYHGINSKYTDFKLFLKHRDKTLFNRLDNLFYDSDLLWSEFEETLYGLDSESIKYEAEEFLVGYGSDEWRDCYHHDYQYRIEEATLTITNDLMQIFKEWVLICLENSISLLRVTDSLKDKKLVLEKNAKFLNFNYTSTLESLYEISAQNIIYIHNKATIENSKLIVGHSQKSTNEDVEYDDRIDIRVQQGEDLLKEYYNKTYKPVEKIILENEIFFNGLFNINKIIVLGHSLSQVDKGYFEKIINSIDAKSTKWEVSYYDDYEIKDHLNFFIQLGINKSLIDFILLNELKEKQCHHHT